MREGAQSAQAWAASAAEKYSESAREFAASVEAQAVSAMVDVRQEAEDAADSVQEAVEVASPTSPTADAAHENASLEHMFATKAETQREAEDRSAQDSAQQTSAVTRFFRALLGKKS